METETTAYVNAMTVTPSSARQAVINDFILGIKNASLWNKLDTLLILHGHDEQATRVNAANPSEVFTAENSPVFASDTGWHGDGSSSFLRGTVNMSSLSHYTQN